MYPIVDIHNMVSDSIAERRQPKYFFMIDNSLPGLIFSEIDRIIQNEGLFRLIMRRILYAQVVSVTNRGNGTNFFIFLRVGA